jgi:hypothetical protein
MNQEGTVLVGMAKREKIAGEGVTPGSKNFASKKAVRLCAGK